MKSALALAFTLLAASALAQNSPGGGVNNPRTANSPINCAALPAITGDVTQAGNCALVFTPESYGAKGDGVTDDTAAFAAMTVAVNAAKSGHIVFARDANYLVYSTVAAGMLGYATLIPLTNDTGVTLEANGATVTVGYAHWDYSGFPNERAVIVQLISNTNIDIEGLACVQTSQTVTLPQTNPVPGTICVRPSGGNQSVTIDNIKADGGNAAVQTLADGVATKDINLDISNISTFGTTVGTQYGVVLGGSGDNSRAVNVYTVGAERTCFVYGVDNVELSCTAKDGVGAEWLLISDNDATYPYAKNIRADFTVKPRSASGAAASDAFIMLEHVQNNGVLENIDVNFNVDYTNVTDLPAAVSIYKAGSTTNTLNKVHIHGTATNVPNVAGHLMSIFDSRSTWSAETVGALTVGPFTATGSATPDFYIDYTPVSTSPALLQNIAMGGAYNPQNSTAAKAFLLNDYLNGTYYSAIPALTVAGTATFGDGSTWSVSGISDTATYSTSTTTAPVNFAFTNSYSSTSNGVAGFALSPTMTPAGASAGNTNVITVQPQIANSSVNIGTLRGLNMTLTEASSYTGTITSATLLNLNAPTVSGNPISNYTAIAEGAVSNGNGITSGTVNNVGFNIPAFTAAAGVGGAIANTAVVFTVPSSSSAGNTDRALWITGNGGAASTKYALYSDSTAPSQMSGNLALKGSAQLSADAMTQTSAAQSGTICYNSGTGAITYDATLGCLSSLEELKDLKGPIVGALAEVMALNPMWARFKPGFDGSAHTPTGLLAEQPVFGAHQVESVDKRLVAYGDDGKLRGVRYMEMAPILAAAIQEQQAEIADLKKQLAARTGWRWPWQ